MRQILPEVEDGKVKWAVAFFPYGRCRGCIPHTEDFVFPQTLVIEMITSQHEVDG